jgi:hypothetical protein
VLTLFAPPEGPKAFIPFGLPRNRGTEHRSKEQSPLQSSRVRTSPLESYSVMMARRRGFERASNGNISA